MRIESQTVNEKWNELTEFSAVTRTELTCLEISDQILGESLVKAEEDLENIHEELVI